MPPTRKTRTRNFEAKHENEKVKSKYKDVEPCDESLTAEQGSECKEDSAGIRKRQKRGKKQETLSSKNVPKEETNNDVDVDEKEFQNKKKRTLQQKKKMDRKCSEEKIQKMKIKEENVIADESADTSQKKINTKQKSKSKRMKSTKVSDKCVSNNELSEKSSSEMCSDDSDFEEVENKFDEKTITQCSDIDNKGDSNTLPTLGSSDSDFEEVLPIINKPVGKTNKKTRNVKTTNIKKKTCQSRKRRGDKETLSGEMKKAKQDLIQDIPGASDLIGVDGDDVTAILMRMEGTSCSQPSTSEGQGHRASDVKGSSLSDDSEDASEEWEEVEEHQGSPLKSRIPTEPIEITLEAPDFLKKKRKKKQFDWQGYVQRTMRRFQKDVQINMHKVHLLCLLSHGFHQNYHCNGPELKALAMSILPDRWSSPRNVSSCENLGNLLKWFGREFQIQTTSEYFTQSSEHAGLVKCDQLQELFASRQICSGKYLVIIFIVILRCLGLDVRLVMSFQPIGIKLAEKDKFNVKQKSKGQRKEQKHEASFENDNENNIKSEPCNRTKELSESESQPVKTKLKDKSKTVRGKDKSKPKSTNSSSKGKQLLKKKNLDNSGSDKKIKIKPQEKVKSYKKKTEVNNRKQLVKEEAVSSDDDDDDVDNDVMPKRTLRKKNEKSLVVKKEELDESESESFSPSEESLSEEEFIVKRKKIRKNSFKKQGSGSKQKDGRKKSVQKKEVIELSSDDEFEDTEKSFRSPLQEKLKRNRKILSSDSNGSDSAEGTSSDKSGLDIWAEVFLTEENRWICVDCVRNIVDKPYELESVVTQPVHYVVAYNTGGYVSDVTARYASQWLSQTRKLRVDSDWWRETLEPYRSPETEHGDNDEENIKDQLLKRPLPTSIGEFKNHPLYALPRHLLKFESIYPETAVPMGYIRGEAIYARECVHTLHSRENWLKEGRCVRIGEEAYKMVKSRKRWREPKLNPDALDLELFGSWQTEKYIPPPAVDGKITRNVYGNIELFKPWMLPGGTVHLQGFPALNRVAKKLDMDCVPAMVGWDSHGGFPHPLIDGWVVCEEQKDILIAAWDEDQEIQRQREIEKREKRVLGNWKLLTRSLLIKERLRKKFDLQEAEPEVEEISGGEKATDLQQSWPQNRKQEKNKKQCKHVETM